MEPAVRALHTDAVHAAVARVAGVDPGALTLLDGFESFVYETADDGDDRIVKATWSGRRTPEQIGAELHFVSYLADEGAPACRAVPLASGQRIESVPAGDGAFHVYAFERAPGVRLDRADWTDAIVDRWGALLGQLHRLSAAYPGPPAPLARPTWEAEYGDIGRILESEPDMHARYTQVTDAIAALPREPGAFGAMHTDLHHHNVHWQDGEPRVFDFDDMLDFWFASDIAIVLYYGPLDPIWHEDDRQADYERLRHVLLEGYAREHTLPAGSLDAIPLFMALREHALRAVVQRSIPPQERTERWQWFLDGATERIRSSRPPLDLEL